MSDVHVTLRGAFTFPKPSQAGITLQLRVTAPLTPRLLAPLPQRGVCLIRQAISDWPVVGPSI